MSGWLPFGVRSGAYKDSPPTQLTITPGDGSHNVGGMINTPAGPDCKFYGGNQIADVIKGAAYGGADACPIPIGQTIQTQTGVSTGNITNKGFDARIGSNTDSFSDVFGQDASGNYYVKKADSPRLGIIPIAEDSQGKWPLSGNAHRRPRAMSSSTSATRPIRPTTPPTRATATASRCTSPRSTRHYPTGGRPSSATTPATNPSPVVYRLIR